VREEGKEGGREATTVLRFFQKDDVREGRREGGREGGRKGGREGGTYMCSKHCRW